MRSNEEPKEEPGGLRHSSSAEPIEEIGRRLSDVADQLLPRTVSLPTRSIRDPGQLRTQGGHAPPPLVEPTLPGNPRPGLAADGGRLVRGHSNGYQENLYYTRYTGWCRL